jgi:hypothetical protein
VNAEVLVALGGTHGEILKVLVGLELRHRSTSHEIGVVELSISRSLGPHLSSGDQNKSLGLGGNELLSRRLSEELDDQFGFIEVNSTQQVDDDGVTGEHTLSEGLRLLSDI